MELNLFGLQAEAGLSSAAAAKMCGYSKRSWERMMRGKQRVPKSVAHLLRCLSGDLGLIDPRWEGWLVKDGRLWIRGDGRTGYTTIEIYNIPSLYGLIAKLERQVEAMLAPASNVIPLHRRECDAARKLGGRK